MPLRRSRRALEARWIKHRPLASMLLMIAKEMRLRWSVAANCDIVAISARGFVDMNPRDNYSSAVERYLKPGSYDVFDFASHQVTLPMPGSEIAHELNDDAVAMIADAAAKYASNTCKDVLTDWHTTLTHSGMHITKEFVALNSFENTAVVGTDAGGAPLKTSNVVYADPQWRWVLTATGSVYALAPSSKRNPDMA